MKWAILTYIIFNPIFFLVNTNQRDAQQLFFQLSSVILFALGMFFHNREIKLSKLNISIGVLLIAFVLAWLRTKNGWFITRNFLYGTLVYVTVIRTLHKDDIKFIFKGLGYLVAICIGILAFQLVGWDVRNAHMASGILTVLPESLFFQRSAMGMFFAQNIPIIASLNVFLSPLLFIPMFWGQSAAAYLGGITGLLFFLWFKKRIFFWGFLVIILIASIFASFQPKVIQENATGIKIRLSMWKEIIPDMFYNPLGYGLDSFANPVNSWRYYNYSYKGEYRTVRAINVNNIVTGVNDKDKEYLSKFMKGEGSVTFSDHPHNEYLWLGYEIGLHALVILGFIYYFIWQRFRFSKKDTLTCVSMAVLLCLAVECLLQFPLHMTRIGHILPVILGIFYITTED